MEKKRKNLKRVLEYSVVLLLVIGIILIYYSVAQEITDFLRMGEKKDYIAVKKYLQDFGTKGAFIISILEMLQMVVVFIPAEFVQIAAGLAYPIYIALPVCIIGICLGATTIFLIVRLFHIRLEIMERRTGKIQQIVSKINKSTPMTIIMYLLFVMPMIPFGAICYFASSSNITYRRYITVVATGVIPSVLSSYILGNVMYHSIGRGTTQFILTVVIVAILMVLLLLTVAHIIKNKFFPSTEIKKPSKLSWNFLYFFVNLYFSIKLKISKKHCQKIQDKQFVLLGNHTSVIDFFFMAKAVYPHRINVISNRFYVDLKSTRNLMRMMQAIPKNLFAPDVETVKKVLKAKKEGCSFFMCPEGRLSSSGENFPITNGTASLVKKLGLPVYVMHTVGGYYAKPKWRKRFGKNKVELHLSQLYSAEQIGALSVCELEEKLQQAFVYDECKAYAELDNVKNKSVDIRGLEGILYRCPNCGKEYSLSTTKTTIKCSECGKEYTFNDRYLSEGKTISDFYREQLQSLGKVSNFNLTENCKVKVFNNKKGVLEDCGVGECNLTNEKITFNGKINGEDVCFTHTLETLFALAFSVREEFEFYVDNKLYYFYPENKDCVVKWSAIWDVLQEKKLNAQV